MYFDSIIFNFVQKLIQEPDNSWKLYPSKRINMIASEILSETLKPLPLCLLSQYFII